MLNLTKPDYYDAISKLGLNYGILVGNNGQVLLFREGQEMIISDEDFKGQKK